MAARGRNLFALVAVMALAGISCATAQTQEMAAALEKLQQVAQDPTNPCIQTFGTSILSDPTCGPWGVMDILGLALGNLPDPMPAGFCTPECDTLVQNHLQDPECADVLALLEPAGLNIVDFKASDLLNTPNVCPENPADTPAGSSGDGGATSGSAAGTDGLAGGVDQIGESVVNLQKIVSENMGAAAACVTSLSSALRSKCGFSFSRLLSLAMNPTIDSASVELCSTNCTEALQEGLTGNVACATIAQANPSVADISASDFFDVADQCVQFNPSDVPVGSGINVIQSLVEEVGMATAADCVGQVTGVLRETCGLSMQEIFSLTTSSGQLPDDICKPICMDGVTSAMNDAEACAAVKDVLAQQGLDYDTASAEDLLGKGQGYCEENLAGREVTGLNTTVGFLADGLPPDWANPDTLSETTAAVSMQIQAALEEAGIPADQFSVDNVMVLVDDAGEPYKVLVGGTVAFFSDEGKSMQDFTSQLKDFGSDIFANISSAWPGSDGGVSLTYDSITVEDGGLLPGTTLQALKDLTSGEPNIEIGTEDPTIGTDPSAGSEGGDSHSPLGSAASVATALAACAFGMALLQ